ncbi:MAG: hypothetical protein ACR2IH_13735 [Pyrinomonadaceae bacterium]
MTSAKHTAIAETEPSELAEPRWAVVSFKKLEAAALTFADAVKKLSELESSKIPGLCIVTDEAGARIADSIS